MEKSMTSDEYINALTNEMKLKDTKDLSFPFIAEGDKVFCNKTKEGKPSLALNAREADAYGLTGGITKVTLEYGPQTCVKVDLFEGLLEAQGCVKLPGRDKVDVKTRKLGKTNSYYAPPEGCIIVVSGTYKNGFYNIEDFTVEPKE